MSQGRPELIRRLTNRNLQNVVDATKCYEFQMVSGASSIKHNFGFSMAPSFSAALSRSARLLYSKLHDLRLIIHTLQAGRLCNNLLIIMPFCKSLRGMN